MSCCLCGVISESFEDENKRIKTRSQIISKVSIGSLLLNSVSSA